MLKNPVIRYVISNHFLTTLIILAIVWFIVQTRGILATVFAAYVLMAGLAPVVKFLRAHKIPKIAAIIVSYSLVIAVVLLLVIPIIPFFAAQIQSLYKNFPLYLNQAAQVFGYSISSTQINNVLQAEIGVIGENALTLTSWIFGGLFSLLTVLVISFYLMLDYNRIRRGFAVLFEEKHEKHVYETMDLLEERLGAWVRGQMLLCFSIAFCTWGALSIIGLEYALPLALLAGILELVPTIGPILSSVPAIIVALTISPATTIVVVIAYFVIQMAENNILVPKIMEKAVGLNPIVIILAVVLGGELMGIVGAFLAIPFILMLVIVVQSFKLEI